METPDPVRSPKLSNHGRVQYSGGGPPGKRTYCTVPLKKSYDGEWSEVRTIWGPPTLGRFRAAESPVWCLPSLSSLLSLPSLDHFSLYLVSTCDFGLAVVCLSRCGSIPPRPLLSLSYPSPRPRELGLASCFKFQASSFLDLNIPLSSSPSPRRALSNTWSLSAGTLSSSHLPSLPPPSVWCERRERFYRLSPLSSLPPAPTCARASWLPPLTLSPNTCLPHRIIPSLHLPPCVCVCLCKRRELDLTLPALGKRTYCTAPHSDQSYDGTWSEVRTICVLPHLAFFAAEPCVMSLSVCPVPPSRSSLSLSR